MKRVANIFFLISTFVVVGMVHVFGQTMSIADYRQAVINYNLDLKQQDEQIKSTLYNLKSVKSNFYPKLNIAANYSYQLESVEFSPGVDLKHDNYGAEAVLSQNVYTGGVVKKQKNIAEFQQAIALLEKNYTLTNVIYAADINYWTTVANFDQYRLSKEYFEIISNLYDVVKARFTKGAIAKTDLLMVETRLKDAELQLNNTITNFKTSLQALNIMMGKSVDNDVILGDSINSIQPMLKLWEVDSILSNRDDYQIAVSNIKLSEEQIKLVKGSYLPQLIVGVKERYGTTSVNIDGKSSFTTVGFVQLSIPILTWGERKGKINIQRTQKESAEYDKQKLQDQVILDVNQAWVQILESQNKINIANSSLEIASSNLELNTFSYNEGRLPILDVLSAQATWIQSYTNLIAVNYQYLTARARYIQAVGGFMKSNESEM